MRARALIPLLALLLTAPALAAPGEADAARRRGLEAMARNDWPAAASELATAAEAFSRDGRVVELAAALEELGTVQLSGLGDPAAALATFERAAAIAERPASAWLWAALAAEQSGRPALARIYKQRALGGAAPTPPARAVDRVPVAPATPAANETAHPPPTSPALPVPSEPRSAASVSSAAASPPTTATPAAAVPEPAATAAPPTAVREPSAPAAAPTPFAHFFAAPAAPAPAAAVPSPGAAPAPAAAPTPFTLFFGPQPGPAPAPGADGPPAAAAAVGPTPAAPPATAPSATPPAASPPAVKGEAFQHFFGAKPKATPRSGEKRIAPTPPAPTTPPPPGTRP